MRRRMLVLLIGCLGALPAAADSYKDVRYISGKAGFPKKINGTLVIEPTELRFLSKDGATVFSVPMAIVHKAKRYTEDEEVLGYPTIVHEFLEVETRTDKGAEAIVFETKLQQSRGMVTKIDFHRLKPAPPPERP